MLCLERLKKGRFWINNQFYSKMCKTQTNVDERKLTDE